MPLLGPMGPCACGLGTATGRRWVRQPQGQVHVVDVGWMGWASTRGPDQETCVASGCCCCCLVAPVGGDSDRRQPPRPIACPVHRRTGSQELVLLRPTCRGAGADMLMLMLMRCTNALVCTTAPVRISWTLRYRRTVYCVMIKATGSLELAATKAQSSRS